MKFEIAFERTHPHPIEKLWRSLTDAEALGAWLMETDFVPEAGREFRMWCDDERGGTDLYLCKVLELDPPNHMVWSWRRDGNRGEGGTTVEFRLEAVSGGTRLTVRHGGDLEGDTIEKYKGGWPVKLDQLEEALRRPGGSRRGRDVYRPFPGTGRVPMAGDRADSADSRPGTGSAPPSTRQSSTSVKASPPAPGRGRTVTEPDPGGGKLYSVGAGANMRAAGCRERRNDSR